MADTLKTVVNVLKMVEKVTSIASSVDPICGLISSLVKVVRQGLQEDEAHVLDKDFQDLNRKMEDISAKNQQCLQQIKMDEVNETFGTHEQNIKAQYTAFGKMVADVKKDPDAADRHMETFVNKYKHFGSEDSLGVYYRGVMGTGALFSQPLLLVYLEHCGRDRTVMEDYCAHLFLLFHMGLIALTAYTAVTDDDDQVPQKWAKRVQEIQSKMEEVLSQCKDESPP